MMTGLAFFLPGQFFFSGILRSGGALIMISGVLLCLAESVSLLRRALSPHPVLWT